MLRDAYPFILVLLILAGLAFGLGNFVYVGFYYLAALLVLLALFVAFFFRNPDRISPADPSLILSPADGHVSVVRLADENEPESKTLISIFLSVFDVHVNRTPIAGKITAVTYKEGQFINAMKSEASIENEQNIVTVQNEQITVIYKQIAGLIARRIVFWKKVGDTVSPGERVGLIKFGSRTDLLLPSNVEIAVKKGDRVIGGKTIIGTIKS